MELRMKNISLLPVEYKHKQRKSKRNSAYTLASGLLIVAYLTVNVSIFIHNYNLRNELQAINVKNDGLRAQIAELQPYKSAQDKIKAINDLISKAAGTNPDWRALLKKAFEDMPEGIWLNGITCSYKDKKGELTLKGSAVNNSVIAEWMNELRSIEELKDLDCKLSSSESQSVQFDLWATIAEGKAWHFDLEGGFQP